MDDTKLHYVTITGIIRKDGRYLIAKRSSNEKAFPNLWTVPGGRISTNDYKDTPRETAEVWYNLLEKVLAREIKEEVGLEVENFGYVTSMAFFHPEGHPVIIISMHCDYKNGEVKLSPELTEYAWVKAEEAKNYPLIEGILEEIQMADKIFKGEKIGLWQKE